MARILRFTNHFEKKLSKLVKAHPELDPSIVITLRLLEKDIRLPSLKTHKLHGEMKNSFSCSVNYQYRIVFSVVGNYIYLESIGSHDDVY